VRLKRFLEISISCISGYFILTLLDQINIIFISAHGATHELAAAGLGNTMICMLASTFIYGVNIALETFIIQAKTRGNLSECWMYVHSAIINIIIGLIPISLILFKTERILLALGTS